MHRRAFARLASDLEALGAQLPSDWSAQLYATFMEAWRNTPQHPDMVEMNADKIITDAITRHIPWSAEVEAADERRHVSCTDIIMPLPGIRETLAALSRWLPHCDLLAGSLGVRMWSKPGIAAATGTNTSITTRCPQKLACSNHTQPITKT